MIEVGDIVKVPISWHWIHSKGVVIDIKLIGHSTAYKVKFSNGCRWMNELLLEKIETTANNNHPLTKIFL